MADINIACARCGTSTTISEYAAADTARCHDCGSPLALPTRARSSGLRIRENGTHAPQSLTPSAAVAVAAPPVLSQGVGQEAESAAALAGVYREREKPKSYHALAGWSIFLALLAALVLMQYAIAQGAPFLEPYRWVRGIGAAVVYLLVLLLAFEDALGHGLASLLFPPYALYYALTRVESFWVRGLFLAMFFGLAAELYFIRDESILVIAQNAVNEIIQGGEGAIQRAGEAPTFQR
jgi:hypothetical protein